MSKWLPIKTAPKEGRVLLYGNVKFGKKISPTFIKLIEIGFFEPNKLYPKFDWIIMYYGKDEVRIKPTHWKPLPSKPKLK